VDPTSGRRRASSIGSRTADHLGAIGEDPAEDEEGQSDTDSITSQNTEGNRDANNFPTKPYWLSDDGLKKGEVDVLSLHEEQFWKDLLEKYLYPIDEDKAEKVKRRSGDLRFVYKTLSTNFTKRLYFCLFKNSFLIFTSHVQLIHV
jgi:chitin synthase